MSVMAFRARHVARKVTLSVTPLIDVLFLLIIFFMLTGTFKRVGELELRLPDSSTATPGTTEAEAHEIVVTVMESGGIQIDGQAVEPADVRSRLAALRDADASRTVLLKAETGVRHGEVVRLLDVVRSVGFPGVGIGTNLSPEREDGGRP